MKKQKKILLILLVLIIGFFSIGNVSAITVGYKSSNEIEYNITNEIEYAQNIKYVSFGSGDTVYHQAIRDIR